MTLVHAPVTDAPPPELLKVEEAAALLRISRAKAYEMAASGELPGVVRIGRSLRVSRRRLLAWLDGEVA